MSDYDAVVVGAGLGGLSAAGFLARAGLRVCLVERQSRVGGCVAELRCRQRSLDPAIGSIARGVEDELRDGILAYLGARDRCELIALEHAYRVVGEGIELEVPLGLDAMIDVHAERFPRERDAIAAFFRTCDRILEDVHRLPLLLRFDELDDLAARFPTFVRYRTARLAEALDEFFSGAQLKSTVAASWPWAGLPPERLSFSTFAQGLALTAHGTYAVQGSFSRLPEALGAAFVDAGGTLVTATAVKRIDVERGSVSGVELSDGRALRARAVVSNADAATTLEQLVGGAGPRMTPSVSATVAFLAPCEPDGRATETFVADEPGGAWVSAPYEGGEDVLAVRALTQWGSTTPPERLLALAERARPGIGEQAEVVATLAPADLAARTGNTDGAIYGWENTPRQTGSRRLSVVGPVEGLYFAGHWAQPGHGAYRALLSGMHAARALLRNAGHPDAIPEFRTAPN